MYAEHTIAFTSPTTELAASRPVSVLVVDDEEPIRILLGTVLERQGYVVEKAADGAEALDAIANHAPDVVILDVRLPVLNGYEVCRRIRSDVRTRLTPVVLVTGYDAQSERVEGLSAGADDFLAKPIVIEELLARVRSLAKIKRYTDDLDSASSILTTLAAMIEGRYGYAPGHCHRMANYSTAVGRMLRVSASDMQALYRGAFLHDVGMLAISDGILQRRGPLNAEEYDQVRAHTTIGDALCAHLRSLQCVRPIIRWHHERLDGSGYPDGLRGEDIPIVAQIVGVVEVYEAVTVPRPYQEALLPAEAFALLRRHADRGWLSSAVVESLVAVIESMQANDGVRS